MTHEEIRKLLGGYATDTLTERERRALMEAALDDQELFNALQDEEALRDLLADPASREQVYNALKVQEKPPAVWWWRRWAWGGLAAAAVAGVLATIVIRWNPGEQAYHRVEIAGSREEPKAIPSQEPQPAARELKEQRNAAVPLTTPPPAAAQALVAPQAELAAGGVRQVQGQQGDAQQLQTDQLQTQQVQTQQVQVPPAQNQQAPTKSFGTLSAARDQAVVAVPPDVSKQFAVGFNGPVSSYSGPLLRYSVFRRNAEGTFAPLAAAEKLKAGDTIRVTVTPGVAGYLAVYRLNRSAEATRVFPAVDAAKAVEANVSYVVPESAVELTSADQRVRVVLAPRELDSFAKTQRVSKALAPAPLIVDIPVAGN
jgi:hypothetical protein